MRTPPTLSSFSNDCDLSVFFKPSNDLIHFFDAPISTRPGIKKFKIRLQYESQFSLVTSDCHIEETRWAAFPRNK